MRSAIAKTFVARAIYHHRQRTDELITLLVYKDSQDIYELLFDDSGTRHERYDGTRDYMLETWGAINRQLIEDQFQRDNLIGPENEFHRFIE